MIVWTITAVLTYDQVIVRTATRSTLKLKSGSESKSNTKRRFSDCDIFYLFCSVLESIMAELGTEMRQKFSFLPDCVPICHGSYGAVPTSILDKRIRC